MSLEIKWHALHLQCPQCNLDFAITTLSVASDATILAEGVCVKCGVQLNWKSDLIKLIRKSVVMDIEESKVSIPNQPLKPPLLLSRPAEHLTDEDLKWEHELGIKPEDLEQ